MSNINTIIFDLDGTLLSMDSDKFMKIYFDEMGKFFTDLIEPKKLISAVWDSTEATVLNLEEKTNEEVFMSTFKDFISGDLESYKKRFDMFYDDSFNLAKEAVFENRVIKKCVEELKEKGYKLAIATNPLFPYKAILKRIEWAGLDSSDFIFISSYEKNHYCKPQIQFYDEVLKFIEKKPEECLMVGNDVQEDLIARKTGIKTYLIKNHIIHRTNEEIKSEYIGNYEEFYQFIKNLPKVNG